MNCLNVYLKNVAVKIQLSFKCGGWTITMRVLDQEPWGLNGAVSQRCLVNAVYELYQFI